MSREVNIAGADDNIDEKDSIKSGESLFFGTQSQHYSPPKCMRKHVLNKYVQSLADAFAK